MQTSLKLSKIFHWLAIVCLMLPFFYTGCDKEKSTDDATDSCIAVAPPIDTVTQTATPISDTIVQAAIQTDSSQTNTQAADTSKPVKDNNLYSQKLVQTLPFVKPILIPHKDTFSGLAILIDNIRYVLYFGIFLFCLFLILGLLFKYFTQNSIKTVVLFDCFALLFLVIAEPTAFEFHRLWSFWITLGVTILLTILDIYIMYQKINKSKNI